MPAPSLVLSLTLHARHAGHAVLDRFGFVPRTIGSWSLKRFQSVEARAQALARFVARAIDQHSPVEVVLGIPARAASAVEPYLTAVRACLEERAIPIVECAHDKGVELLLGVPYSSPPRRLRDVVLREFAPDFEQMMMHPNPRDPLNRAAWYAAALALAQLAHAHPRVAFALYRAQSPLVDFLLALRHAEHLISSSL